MAILSHGKILRTGTILELTQSDLAYRVDAGRVAPEVLEAIRSLAGSVEASNGSLHIRVPSLEGLNACLDRLRGAGNLIRQVTPESSTLEESFLRILQGEEERS